MKLILKFICNSALKAFSLLLLILIANLYTSAQRVPNWYLRTSFSPMTEDVFGFGVSYHPDSSRWFQQLELYPLQNRGSDITIDPINLGGILRTNIILNDITGKFHLLGGAEIYAYRYSRQILGSPGIEHVDMVTQMMIDFGAVYKLGDRINCNLVIPIFGFENVKSKSGIDNSNSTTPAILGFFGFFNPKFGLEIGLF